MGWGAALTTRAGVEVAAAGTTAGCFSTHKPVPRITIAFSNAFGGKAYFPDRPTPGLKGKDDEDTAHLRRNRPDGCRDDRKHQR